MKQGYRDVGYLLAARLPEFRPAQYTVTKWRQLIARLDRCLETQNTAAVQAWFRKHYSALMHSSLNDAIVNSFLALSRERKKKA